MKILFTLLFISISLFQYAQQSITFRPDAVQGKDVYLRDIVPNTNQGNSRDFPAIAWTNGGTPVIARGLLDFELNQIPAGAIIDSAFLSLYSYVSSGNGTHSMRSGSNESVLQRVTQNWAEFTVTWNTQPASTSVNQVILPPTSVGSQHYLNINVTAMVNDMHNDPLNGHGFLIKLTNEQYYRSMIFASSDHPDTSLHPKLVVFYTLLSTALEEKESLESNFTLFPNLLHKNTITIRTNQMNGDLQLHDNSGILLYSSILNQSLNIINLPDLASGIYFVSYTKGEQKVIRKIVKR